jgi:hypothetical protein
MLMNTNYVREIEQNGFAILEAVVEPETVKQLVEAVASARVGGQRAGVAFGIRNLLNTVPFTREIANSGSLRSLVDPILGSAARVVRGIYFDKHKDANWKVAWHQDLTIAVRERLEVEGYGPWSMKAGITHVQPPAQVLENMLAIRLHLDHTDESNGALRVLPSTHKSGRLEADQIQHWKDHEKVVTCSVGSGGVMVMRPLLLHSSSAAVNPVHRRVLHFEYSSANLPSGLKWFEAPLSGE